MRFLVEFKLPDGSKLIAEVDASSHLAAAEESVFDVDILDALVGTGRDKFSARVRRESDNVTRMVLVGIDGGGGPAQASRKHDIKDSRVCNLCGRERVPLGYPFDVPDGAVVCEDCGIPLKDEPQHLEGFENVKEEVVEENPPSSRACESCGDLATEEDDEGVPLCEDCYLELIEENEDQRESGEEPQAPQEPSGERFYLVVFGDHLEPGDEDRVALRIKADNPRIALTSAEYVVEGMDDKGPEWLEAYYEVGLTPTLSACEPPANALPPANDEANQKLYEATVYLGNQTITGEVEAAGPEEACSFVVTQEVERIVAATDNPTTVAASAVNKNDVEDSWGPGVVRVPVELVVSFDQMDPAQKRGALAAIGVERWSAGPALDLGTADPKVQ